MVTIGNLAPSTQYHFDGVLSMEKENHMRMRVSSMGQLPNKQHLTYNLMNGYHLISGGCP